MRRSTLSVVLSLGLAAAAPVAAQPADAGLPLEAPRARRAVIHGGADLRRGPSPNAEALLRLGAGEHRVTVLATAGAWVRVRVDDRYGSTGYVPADRLSGPSAGQGVDLPAEVAAALALVRDPRRFHAGNATALMEDGFARLLAIDPDRVDAASLERDPEGLLRALFGLMLALDERMAAFDAAGRMDAAMAAAKRRVLRGLRFLRERVLVHAHERQPERLYEGGRPGLAATPPTVHHLERYHWTVHPEWQGRRLEAGSFPRTFFLVNVSNTVTSSAIARSAAVDNMFSHFSVGYIADRPQTVEGVAYPAGTIFTIEALIESGVVIRPIEEHFKKSMREVLFVVRDRSRQAAVDAAADAFFARARDALDRGEPLGYDFTMGHGVGLADRVAGREGDGSAGPPRLMDLSNFFCSGVGEAIGQAAGVELFPHRSHLEAGRNSRSLFESWGVDPARPVPAPGDADVSTHLLRVAEGAAAEGLVDLHLSQQTLGAMFRWLDEDDFALRAPGALRIGAAVVGLFNDSPLDLGLVPSGMNPEILKSFLPMDKAGALYYERLRAENEAFRARHGRPMTPREMDRALEALRDDVDASKWFVRGPGGRYVLRPTWYAFGPKPEVRLEVQPTADGGYLVRREVVRRGQIVGRGAGRGARDAETLRVRFDQRQGDQPAAITYTFEHDGSVQGTWREDGDHRAEEGTRTD